jgi:hypothetical protein
MPEIGDRLVYHDRISNLGNAFQTFLDYGIYPALETLVIGFGENNRKLLQGTKAKVSKGGFNYNNAYSTRMGGRFL